MSDILSQNEIDELLKAVNTGEVDDYQTDTSAQDKRIKIHDFRRPSKFAKDHLRTLSIINESYARLVTNFLSGYLRSLVQVEALSVEPISYFEFCNALANPVVLAIADFSPLSGSIIIEIPPNISFALVDRILGGRGAVMDKYRGFTEIELAILERIVIQLLNLMKEPWGNVLEVKPKLEKIETNAQFAQILSPNEIVALGTLQTKIGETEGVINICIPHISIEPVLHKLSSRLWFSQQAEKGVSEEIREALKCKIEDTAVPIKVVMGKTVVSVGDLMELQPGDVIQLDTGINSDLEVMVGDLLKFYGKPGVRRNKIAVKVTEVIRKVDD